jgi:hypothetical protein
MKQVFLWGINVVLACTCFFFGVSFYGQLTEYKYLRNDIGRQTNVINSLNSDRAQPHLINIKSAPETINYFSRQMTSFELLETSLKSEKSYDQLDDWEEWRIEAECAGRFENIYKFIDALESADIFYDLNFSIDLNNDNQNILKIRLLFYTYNE